VVVFRIRRKGKIVQGVTAEDGEIRVEEVEAE